MNTDNVPGILSFLGMVNNANIDWFFPWPEQALYAVASVFISPDVSWLLLWYTCIKVS